MFVYSLNVQRVCKCVVCECWCDVYVLVMCSVMCVY